jgi:hypothetical protein
MSSKGRGISEGSHHPGIDILRMTDDEWQKELPKN